MKDKKFLFLTAFLLLTAGLSASALYFQHTRSSTAGTAYIHQDGRLLREIDLSAVSSPYTFTIKTPDGAYNTIQVMHGKIGITDTNCPDKTCQNMGMTDSSACPIICLPHKLIITISDDGKTTDAVVG